MPKVTDNIYQLTVSAQGLATLIAGLTVMLDQQEVLMTQQERLLTRQMLGELRRELADEPVGGD